MMRPLSFPVGVSISSSFKTPSITALISSSFNIFGANSSYTAMRLLHSSIISVLSAGVISKVSFVCLISFKTTSFSSASVKSSLLSIALFFSADKSMDRESFLSLSFAFIAATIAFLTSSALLIMFIAPFQNVF